MELKEALFINKINQYLKEEVIPEENTFSFALQFPETTEFDVKTLRATHLETRLMETLGQVEELEILVIYFETEKESDIAISIDMYNSFCGLYHLDDYQVCFDASHGVWLDEVVVGRQTYGWLEYLLNENDMGDWLVQSGDLEDVMSEVNDKNLLPLEEVQLISQDIIDLKMPSVGYLELVFISGASLILTEEQVLRNIKKAKNKEN